MLRIRPEQLRALSGVAEESFLDRLESDARRHFPPRADELGPDGLRPFLRETLAAGRGFGLVAERELARYVNLRLFWGPAFPDDPRTPWAREILERETLEPHVKVHQLVVRTRRAERGD